MKKIVYIALILVVGNEVHAQGFLNKLKNKVNNVVNTDKPASTAEASASSANSAFTDPAKFGTLIKTYSRKELDQAMGGESGGAINGYFRSFKVVNNQLQGVIVDNYAVYNYQNGQLQPTGEKPDGRERVGDLYNGSEQDRQSKDFSTLDATNAILKKGPHLQENRTPGKADVAYTFNGKPIGRFVSAYLSHNADSSVIGVVGTSYGKGVSYILASSTGQTFTLPTMVMGSPYVSTNGKMSVAVAVAASGITAYRIDGTKTPISNFASGGLVVHNNGTIFYFTSANGKTLMKNNEVLQTFKTQVNLKTLFIGPDDKTFCWEGDHGLYFSDGTAFENANFPIRATVNNKEIVFFLAVNVTSGKLYLCQHEL